MKPINVTLVGAGNCASSLIQGIYYYQNSKPEEVIGLMHWNLGGVLHGSSSFFCKHPSRQVTDDVGFHLVEEFIQLMPSTNPASALQPRSAVSAP